MRPYDVDTHGIFHPTSFRQSFQFARSRSAANTIPLRSSLQIVSMELGLDQILRDNPRASTTTMQKLHGLQTCFESLAPHLANFTTHFASSKRHARASDTTTHRDSKMAGGISLPLLLLLLLTVVVVVLLCCCLLLLSTGTENSL